jgi:hypothetical protein
MNELEFKEFSSAQDIIIQLKKKYNEDTGTIGSKKRFPASIIFFSSKKQYKHFLEQAPWTFCRFSDVFITDKIPSEYKIKQWFEKALDESKKRPLILTPITEFIRIHQSQSFSSIITKIVQSEGSEIIIPMLDFFGKYQQFGKDFIHKDRMAEVYAQNEPDIDDDRDIELIFDKTGRITTDSEDVVNSPKDWILLWETGDIANKKRLLIHDKTIVTVIENADISVPKIKKIFIHSIKDYLQYEFSISQSIFQLDPDDNILNFILSKKDQIQGHNFWDSLEKIIFSDPSNFEEQIFNYWDTDKIEDNKLYRWFWLNKAKSTRFDNKFLSDIVLQTDDPEKLIDTIYFAGLEKVNVDLNFLRERRNALTKFTNPVFFSDSSTLEEKFNYMLKSVGEDPSLIVERVVGIFDFERKIIVKIVPKLLTIHNELSPYYFSIIKQIWPEYAYYIEPSLHSTSPRSFDLTKEFSEFAKIYTEYYILSKVMFDNPTEELEALQKEFRAQWKAIIAAQKIGKIENHSNGRLLSEIKDKKFIFLDAVGYEWGNLIKYLFEKRGWQVLNTIPIFAPLPSATKYFPSFLSPIEQTDEFDQLLHKPYEYPGTIEQEIQKLTNIIDTRIHEKFKGLSQPIWVVSDHGSTAFARKGSTLPNFKNDNKKHGGRYSIFAQEPILETDDLKIISYEGKEFLISTNYDNIGKTRPLGEAHGGATPEEILAIAILVIPPGLKQQQSTLLIESEKSQYSAIDEIIKLIIKMTSQEKISEIKISVNNSPRFSLDMKYYQQRVFSIPLPLLKEKGLTVGINNIQLTINNRETTTIEIHLESGSQMTGFDEKFKF